MVGAGIGQLGGQVFGLLFSEATGFTEPCIEAALFWADRCYTSSFPMPDSESRSSNGQLYLYFSLLGLLVNITNPQSVLDIPTSFMLKDLLHASAWQVSCSGRGVCGLLGSAVRRVSSHGASVRVSV